MKNIITVNNIKYARIEETKMNAEDIYNLYYDYINEIVDFKNMYLYNHNIQENKLSSDFLDNIYDDFEIIISENFPMLIEDEIENLSLAFVCLFVLSEVPKLPNKAFREFIRDLGFSPTYCIVKETYNENVANKLALEYGGTLVVDESGNIIPEFNNIYDNKNYIDELFNLGMVKEDTTPLNKRVSIEDIQDYICNYAEDIEYKYSIINDYIEDKCNQF